MYTVALSPAKLSRGLEGEPAPRCFVITEISLCCDRIWAERAFQAEHKSCLGPGGKEEYSVFDSIVSMFHTCRRLRNETWRSREKMNEERPFMDFVLRLI